MAETTVKRLLCCEFRSSGKAMGQVYQFWGRICRGINVFPRFDSHLFYVSYSFVTYLLTFLHNEYERAILFVSCLRVTLSYSENALSVMVTSSGAVRKELKYLVHNPNWYQL
jgi:hypothetical protein